MKHGKNVSNIEMVKAYQSGERPFTQIGYTKVEDRTKREVGETWTDSDGKVWIQKEYGKISHTPVMDIVSAETNVHCSDCGKEIKWGTKQDSKIFAKTGMCLDCLALYETKLRIQGKWKAHEQKKLLENQLAYVMDVKSKVKEGLEYMKVTKSLTFVNSNGTVDNWEDTKRDDLIKSLRKDHVKCLKEVKRLSKEIKVLSDELSSVPNEKMANV